MASAAVLVLGLGVPAPAAPQRAIEPASSTPVNVLVFHGPPAEQGDPVTMATAAIKRLGEEHGFTVEVSEDPGVFTVDNLARFRGVVFLSARGVTLNEDQEAAFRAYITAGGAAQVNR